MLALLRRWSLTASLLASVLCASCTQGPLDGEDLGLDDDKFPPVTVEILEEDSRYMTALVASGDYQLGMPVDLTDPRQYRAVRNRLIYGGYTPDSDPAVFALLSEARKGGDSYKATAGELVDLCGAIGTIERFDEVTLKSLMDYSCFESEDYLVRGIRDQQLKINGRFVPPSLGGYDSVEYWEGSDPPTSEVELDVSTSMVSALKREGRSFMDPCDPDDPTNLPYNFASCDGYSFDVTQGGPILVRYAICQTMTDICPGLVADQTLGFRTLDMAHPGDVNGDANPSDGDPDILLCMNRFWLGEGLNDCDYFIDWTKDGVDCATTPCCPDDHLCENGYTGEATTPEKQHPLLDNPAVPYTLYVPFKGSDVNSGTGLPSDTGAMRVRNDLNILEDETLRHYPGTLGNEPPTITSAEAWLTLNTASDADPGGGICAVESNLLTNCITFHKYVDPNTGMENDRLWYFKIASGNSACVPRMAQRWEGSNCQNARQDADLHISIVVEHDVRQFAFDDPLLKRTPFVWRVDQSGDVDDLTILWGCMPPGTDIRMADGTIKKVEEVRSGDLVISDPGRGALTVTRAMIGDEDKPLIHIEVDLGHQLALTTAHPVPLVGGRIVAAEDLQVGDVVWTDGGAASLTRVEYRDYRGKVYNLELGSEHERAQIQDTETTMFANGVLVGDARMQGMLPVLRTSESSDPSTRIPPEFMVDYQSSMRRRAARQNWVRANHNGQER